MVEVLSGILTGIGFGSDPDVFESRHGIEHRHNDGCFILVINVGAFRSLEKFKKETTEFSRFVKTSPPAEGSSILYPGEPEYRNEKKLLENGIYVEDTTWSNIKEVIDELGLEKEIGEPY
jgi:uncharacterized oxidoreductase